MPTIIGRSSSQPEPRASFFHEQRKNQSNHYYPILKGQHNNTYRHVRSLRQPSLQGIQLATSGTWSASNSLLRWMIDYIINCQVFDTFGKLIIKLMQMKTIIYFGDIRVDY